MNVSEAFQAKEARHGEKVPLHYKLKAQLIRRTDEETLNMKTDAAPTHCAAVVATPTISSAARVD